MFDGEGGGEGCLGFHEIFPGLGRVGGGFDGGLDVEDCFSKAAILSRSEPIFFGGGDSSAIVSLSILEIGCEGERNLSGNNPADLRHIYRVIISHGWYASQSKCGPGVTE